MCHGGLICLGTEAGGDQVEGLEAFCQVCQDVSTQVHHFKGLQECNGNDWRVGAHAKLLGHSIKRGLGFGLCLMFGAFAMACQIGGKLASCKAPVCCGMEDSKYLGVPVLCWCFS